MTSSVFLLTGGEFSIIHRQNKVPFEQSGVNCVPDDERYRSNCPPQRTPLNYNIRLDAITDVLGIVDEDAFRAASGTAHKGLSDDSCCTKGV
jgi:hypothetical protein